MEVPSRCGGVAAALTLNTLLHPPLQSVGGGAGRQRARAPPHAPLRGHAQRVGSAEPAALPFFCFSSQAPVSLLTAPGGSGCVCARRIHCALALAAHRRRVSRPRGAAPKGSSARLLRLSPPPPRSRLPGGPSHTALAARVESALGPSGAVGAVGDSLRCQQSLLGRRRRQFFFLPPSRLPRASQALGRAAGRTCAASSQQPAGGRAGARLAARERRERRRFAAPPPALF